MLIKERELAEYAYRRPNLPPSSMSGGFERIATRTAESVETLFDTEYTFVEKLPFVSAEVHSSADIVTVCAGRLTVELVISVRRVYRRFNIAYNASYAARGAICAACAAHTLGFSEARVILTFKERDGEETVSFFRDYTLEVLKKMMRALLERAEVRMSVFAQKETLRIEEIRKMSFPYSELRTGQQELMLAVMRTARRGGHLLAQAPTGTGKTMAMLYPAVKALGEGFVAKIFYLTGKTVTGHVALDAMRRLAESSPSLRCIMLKAKEQSCPEKSASDGCFGCCRLNDCELFGDVVSYRARRDAALAELLTNKYIVEPGDVEEYANRYMLCPHELSLDASELCDVIICDYNYVFDDNLRIKRYFSRENGEKYIILTDECHNLPDRVRGAYSAEIGSAQFDEMGNIVSEKFAFDEELLSAYSELCDIMMEQKELCIADSVVKTDTDGEHRIGYCRAESPPANLGRACEHLGRLFFERSRTVLELAGQLRDVASKLFAVAKAVSAATVAESSGGFAYLAELCDDALDVSVVCLDPSSIITRLSASAHAVVMFSATLSPSEYFADMLGMHGERVLKAESPFERDNLCIAILDGISTRFSMRKNTAREIAEAIATVIETREGHYLVFFPSYAYMKTVARELLSLCDVNAVMQKPTMSHRDREKFVAAFKSRKFTSLVGLCVLGGVFSEGIDLAGDELIGVIVVGAGLPGLSSQLNLMSEYFEEKYGNGRLYAYEYPAINRIEQAAGRVIRTPEDYGVVVLIDDRLSSREMVDRFPEHWPRPKCTSQTETLSVILSRFWSSFN